MSAETLREAAARIRTEQEREENLGHIDGQTYAAWLAVANVLDNEADLIDAPNYWTGGKRFPDHEPRPDVVAVAREYLGESA